MRAEEKPTIPFMFSLLGGILLLLGAIVFLTIWPPLGTVGVVLAVVELLASVMLYYRPQEALTWGIIILVFAVIAFGPWNAFGGFAIGSILAIVGGGMAISRKPVSQPWSVAPGGPYAWAPAGPVPYPAYSGGWQPGLDPGVGGPTPATAESAASPQGVPQTAPRFCTNCGSPALPGGTYCGACGTKLGWGIPSRTKSE